MKILKFIPILFSVLAFAACQSFDESRYNAQDALEAFDADFIIDARTPAEYQESHIKGALNMPVDSISEQILVDRIDKNAKIVVYCRRGIRASKAKQILDSMGYKNVRNIGGLEPDVLPSLQVYIDKKYPLPKK
ncbi:MAG: rhodanese-like domain-containing protein [Opitutales bacterium]|nr:rhodanese-like domain-containing protein [Opitutales bacterium]